MIEEKRTTQFYFIVCTGMLFLLPSIMIEKYKKPINWLSVEFSFLVFRIGFYTYK